MDRTGQLELYLSETNEHLRLLSRGILAMESGVPAAIEEAFRAAHTIKGLAAAMGHEGASAIAHGLEDRLASAVRGGTDPDHIDALLAGADALAAAIAAAVRGDDPGPAATSPAASAAPSSTATEPGLPSAAVPAGTVLVARVRLDPTAPLPGARALLIHQNARRAGGVLSSWPPPADVAHELHLFLSGEADQAQVEQAIIRAGGVHEVRFEPPPQAPGASQERVEDRRKFVRVDRDRLDALAEGVAELSVLYERARVTDELPDRASWRADRVGALLAELRQNVIDMRMVAVGEAFERFARLVRDAAKQAGKEIDFSIEGEAIELDQAVLDAVIDPLVHLLRNAVDHGIEPAAERSAAGKPARGRIRLSAKRERNSVRLVVQDDGRGIAGERLAEHARATGMPLPDAADPGDDLLRLLAQPGFSTAATVTALSGRGIGLDVVVNRIRSLGGAIDLETTPGAGTTFTLRLPLTLALAHALRVRVGGEEYAIPLTHVTEAIALETMGVDRPAGARETVLVRDQTIPLIRLGSALATGTRCESAAVIAEAGERRIALGIDELIGHEQILVKSFDPPVGVLPMFSGATLLADGRPALLIDPLSLA